MSDRSDSSDNKHPGRAMSALANAFAYNLAARVGWAVAGALMWLLERGERDDSDRYELEQDLAQDWL